MSSPEWTAWTEHEKETTSQHSLLSVFHPEDASSNNNLATTGANVSDASPWHVNTGGSATGSGWTTTNIYNNGSSEGSTASGGTAQYGVSGDGTQVGSASSANNGDGTVGSSAQTSNSNNPLYSEPAQATKTAGDTTVGSAVPTSSSGGPGLISMAGWAFERGVAGYASIYANKKYQRALSARIEDGGMANEDGTAEEGLSNAAKKGIGGILLGSWAADTVLDRTILEHKGTSWKTFAVDIASPFLASYMFGRTSVIKIMLATVGAHVLEKELFEKTK